MKRECKCDTEESRLLVDTVIAQGKSLDLLLLTVSDILERVKKLEANKIPANVDERR